MTTDGSNSTKDRKKGHKTRFICALFASNATKQLSDAALAKTVLAEYPDSESNWEQRMPALRRLYNTGSLPGQKGKPGKQSERYGIPAAPAKAVHKNPGLDIKPKAKPKVVVKAAAKPKTKTFVVNKAK